MTAASPVGQLESGRVTPSHKWLIALAVMLGPALEVLDTSIINVALPHLQGVFSASVDEIAWVLTNQLPRGQRGHDPDDRLDFLSLWPQALFPYLGIRFHRRLRSMWRGAVAQPNGRIPSYSPFPRKRRPHPLYSSVKRSDAPSTGNLSSRRRLVNLNLHELRPLILSGRDTMDLYGRV